MAAAPIRQRFAVETPDGRAEIEMTVRPGTSDIAALDQVYGARSYDLRGLRRFAEIAAIHREVAARGRRNLILDLGANIGAAARYFAQAWPASHVVAVEPAADNFELLFENTQDLDNTTALLCGIASVPGWLRIVDATAEKWTYRTERAQAQTPQAVRAVTVPELLGEYSSDAGYDPFIVKIDIEGAESELFSGNVDWIDRFPVLIIELHDWLFCGQGGSGPFLRAIAARNRDFILAGENVFSIANHT
ncbi:MAG TPA: FkbM family methyltransferase [Burkholderiales bacterium]|nr:FkbM family methyltransferase [Burkholderiales bacterium]